MQEGCKICPYGRWAAWSSTKLPPLVPAVYWRGVEILAVDVLLPTSYFMLDSQVEPGGWWWEQPCRGPPRGSELCIVPAPKGLAQIALTSRKAGRKEISVHTWTLDEAISSRWYDELRVALSLMLPSVVRSFRRLNPLMTNATIFPRTLVHCLLWHLLPLCLQALCDLELR